MAGKRLDSSFFACNRSVYRQYIDMEGFTGFAQGDEDWTITDGVRGEIWGSTLTTEKLVE